MSIRLMTQLWDNADPELSGSRLVIMLCLADHANDDGECWPSIDRLARRARLHRQNVMVHLRELEDAGYITVKRIQGRHNSYIVRTTSNETVTRNETVTGNVIVTTTSNATVTRPVTPSLPEPSVNRKSKRKEEEGVYAPVSVALQAFAKARGANINPTDPDYIAEFVTLYGDAETAQAITYCDKNKRDNFLRMNYIQTILSSWQADGTLGLHTPEYEANKAVKRGNGAGRHAEQDSVQEKLARVFASLNAEEQANGNPA